MLVRKCDVCGHIIGNGEGYMMDVFKTFMPGIEEVRSKTLEISLEICFECKQAMFNIANERLSKYVIIEKEREVRD